MPTYTPPGLLRPTAEQSAILDLFSAGDNIAVEAGAGTGKTSTLAMLARSTDRTGRYLAFNRSIVEDSARKFPMSVATSTVHSLAMRAVGRHYRHRLNSDRMPGYKLAAILQTPTCALTAPSGLRKELTSSYTASLVMRAIRNYCYSDDAEPGPEHVPYVDGIDARDESGRRTFTNNTKLAAYLADPIARAWDDLRQPDGRLPFQHDHYLKLYALDAEQTVEAEYLVVDEAQDLSPVMLGIVRRYEGQTVLVGDSQQSIMGWRGAVNALDEIDVDSRAILSRSFRFGPPIADVANGVLDLLDAPLRLVGSPDVVSSVGPVRDPDAILCRSNAAAVATMLALQHAGEAVHLMGGGADVMAFARAAIALQAGEKTTHPDLVIFDTWTEVQDYVSNDPQGDELALLVKLLDEYGPQIVLDALSGMPAEDNADVVVSTAHKAKGREWGSVRLAGDFPGADLTTNLADEEWRLLYVAATRARFRLDDRLCEALQTIRPQTSTGPTGW